MLYLGIDVGSLTCDAVLIDEQAQLIASTVVPTGARNLEAIARARREVCEAARVSPEAIKTTIATGYGRNRVEGRLASVTEISCHARGIGHLFFGTSVLIDIGGQDSKAIHLDPAGRVVEFAMNDKCAAGTGRFLEAMARALEVEVDQLGPLDQDAESELTLSSMCTVFAESEIISLIAEGTAVTAIVHGLHRAIAMRTLSLVRRVVPQVQGRQVAMSGGVARNSGVVKAIAAALECEIHVPAEPDIVGALGAALMARER